MFFVFYSAYGEGLFLTIQTSLIAFLILFFGGNAVGAVMFGALYTGIMGYLLSGLCPIAVLSALQSINIPIVILSKVRLFHFFITFLAHLSRRLSFSKQNLSVVCCCHHFILFTFLSFLQIQWANFNQRHKALGQHF